MKGNNLRKRPAKSQSSFLFEELEPRLLLSADLPVDLASDFSLRDESFTQLSLNELEVLETGLQQTSTYGDLVSEVRRELVFVDTDTPEYQQLLDDLLANQDETRQFEVILLDNESDGVSQITEALGNASGLDAVHIISHGTDGSIDLGNGALNYATLLANADLIRAWGSSFTEDGDLLIYGCNLAATADGQSLINSLANLTGADVAASDDLTGNSELGGDWELEYRQGDIETAVAVSAELQQSWFATLGVETVSDDFSTGDFTGDTGSVNWSGGWIEVDSSGAGAGTGKVQIVTGELRLNGIPVSGDDPSLARQVDLSSATAATLSFDFSTGSGVESADPDSITVEVSDNGGSTWTLLEDFNSFDGVNTGSRSYDISAFTAVNTQIRFRANNGYGGSDEFFYVDNVQIDITEPAATADSLWLTTNTNPAPSGANGLTTEGWTAGEVLQLSDPNLAFGAGTTDGTFTRAFNLDNFAQDGSATVRGTHYVGRDMTVGTNNFQLYAGDLIMAVSGEVLQNSDLSTLTTSFEDVVVFRPDAAGDYSAGMFSMLLNDLTAFTANAGITLVEQTTVVGTGGGATTLNAGDFLFSDFDDQNVIFRYQPGTVGATTSGGATTTLVDGADLGITGLIAGFDLIERDTTIGGTTLAEGQILVTLGQNENPVGGIATQEQDIFILDITTTGINTVGTAQAFFTGADVGLNMMMEDISGFTLVPGSASANAAPTATNLNAPETYTEDTALNLTNIVITDVDSANVTATLTLSDVAAGSLSIGTSGAVTSTFVGGVWSASGAVADVNTLLAGATFTPGLNYNSNFTIATSVDDGVAAPITGVKNMTGTAVNDDPVADAGGPYSISEGGSITLDASASSDPDSDPLTYSWDINNDTVFGDITGESPALTWAQLQSFGINDDGVYTIKVQADDGTVTNTASTTITVNNTAPVLGTAGSVTVNEGSSYTLNLNATDPGNDTISGWTINWGDGDVETIVGDPASVTHLYGARGTFNILAAATDEDGTYLQNNLLVGGFIGTNSILEYEATSGNFVQLIGSLGDGLNLPHSVIQGPDGYLYVSSYSGDSVLRYDTAGNFIDTFVTTASGGLNSPTYLTFGADDNLYVSSLDTNQILRYNGTTGAFIDAFVTASSGGLTTPSGITFGADGNLYVSSLNTNEILRYNGTTGAFMDAFVSAGSGGMGQPAQLTFGPDGNLYVASRFDDAVHRYDGTTGAYIDAFVTSASGGIDGNVGLAFGPDGNLYVSARTSNDVMRYDGTTGAFVDAYVSAGSGGLSGPGFITFVADQQVRVNGVPTDIALSNSAVNENVDTTGGFSVGSLTTSDPDNYESFSYSVVGGAAMANFSIGGVGSDELILDDGTLDFETRNSYQVTVRTTDSRGATFDKTLTVTVNDLNDAPVVINDSYAVNEGATLNLDLSSNDNDVDDGLDLASIVITSAPANGSVVVNANGTVDYTHDGSETVSDGFTYTIKDNSGVVSNTGTVTITVNPVNDTPTMIFPGAVQNINEDTPLVFSIGNGNQISVGDADANGNELLIDFLSFNGTLMLNGTAGLTFIAGDGIADTSMQFTGTIADINAAVEGLTFTPDAEFSGGTNFQMWVNDQGNTGSGFPQQTTRVALISVAPVNDAPVGLPTITGTVTEDQMLTADTSGISDVDGPGVFSYQWLRDGFAIGAATASTYTLGDADVGTLISVQVSYTDSNGTAEGPLTSVQTAAVVNINDAPVAVDDSYNIIEGSGGFLPPMGVLINDSDIDSGALTAIQLSNVANGTLSMNPNGSWWYSPDPDYYGTDSFTYKVNDGSLDSNIATVTLNIAPRNDAPAGSDNTVTTLEDTDYIFSHTDFGFSDPVEGDGLLAVRITTLPGAGALTLVGSGAVSAGDFISKTDIDANKLIFTPVANANGTGYASFTFQVQDSGGTANGGVDLDQSTNTLTIDVTAVNDAPVANSALILAGEDTGQTASAPGLMSNDTDAEGTAGLYVYAVDGNPASVGTTITLASGALLTVNADGSTSYNTNGAFEYLGSGDSAVDSFTYTISDAGGLTSIASVTVFITGANDAPVTNNISASGDEDTASIAITLTGSDIDGTVEFYRLNGLPADGTLYTDAGLTTAAATATDYVTTAGALTLYFVPNANWNGTTAFQYVAKDDGGLLDVIPATATIVVNPVNDAPVISTGLIFNLAEDAVNGSSIGGVIANDVDASGSQQNWQIVSGNSAGVFQISPSTGELSVVDNTALDYESNTNYVLGIQVGDGVNTSIVEAITLDVINVNEAPYNSVPATQTTSENTPLVFSSLDGNGITVSDPDGSGTTVEVTLAVLNGTLGLSGTGGLAFSTGSGTGDTAMTFTGNVVDINTALDGLLFQPDAGYQGFSNLTIITDDLGGSGVGGALNAMETVTISVVESASAPSLVNILTALDELIDDFSEPQSLDPVSGVPSLSIPANNPVEYGAEDTSAPGLADSALPETQMALTNGSRGGLPGQIDISAFQSHDRVNFADLQHDRDRPSSSELIQRAVHLALANPLLVASTLAPLAPGAPVWSIIDIMMGQMSSDDGSSSNQEQILVKTTKGLTFTLTAGYVSWLLRAGYLSASLVSIAPLWREFDPLPILAKQKKTKRQSDEEAKASPGSDEITAERIFAASAQETL